jgi:hypothetical protein
MRRLAALLLVLAAVVPAGRAAADDAPVDVALVLAVDVSLSMDFREQRTQRDGYVEALTHPAVLDAIARGARGRIAVAYMEWGGPWTQRLIAPWTLVDGPESAQALAETLAVAPIETSRGTSMTEGLKAAAALFADAPPATRRVIDMSGDGPNNMGGPVTEARDRALAQGIEINGLPLMLGAPDLIFSIPELDIYYQECVIGGPSAFVIPVTDMRDFATAVRTKLILEIAGLAPPRVPPRDSGRIRRAAWDMDCLIGEKLYERWRRTQDWN